MAVAQPTERHEEIQFHQLLEEAVTKPGTLMRAYHCSGTTALAIKFSR